MYTIWIGDRANSIYAGGKLYIKNIWQHFPWVTELSQEDLS